MESYYFKEMTGIYTENESYRLALIELKKNISADVTWVIIKNASRFFDIDFKNAKIIGIRKFTAWETFQYYVSHFLFFISYFIGGLLAVSALFINNILLFVAGGLMIFIAILSLALIRPHIAAKQLSKIFKF